MVDCSVEGLHLARGAGEEKTAVSNASGRNGDIWSSSGLLFMSFVPSARLEKS